MIFSTKSNFKPVSSIIPKIKEAVKFDLLALSFYVLSRLNLLLYQFVSKQNTTHSLIEEKLLQLAFGSNETIDCSELFNEIDVSNEKDSFIGNFEKCISLLTPEQTCLFCSMIVDEETNRSRRINYITIDAVDFNSSFLENYFNNSDTRKILKFMRLPSYFLIDLPNKKSTVRSNMTFHATQETEMV